ncbi:SAM-dependent methyltransferase [Nonomuraea sp. NN258]|uniref:SAM-dependent methyltransferase n=1 Tax=Nonomuraea antri TaxID=2730852 RepID=UPI0015682B82|nr:SAM-dependent methyltransferase [Nonomuraea antri]NRQ31724.1 SAM-dependent methyltransferase [Nonomuraea antri]
MSENEAGTLKVDPHLPNPARIYNYFLGGKDNFAADRAAAEQVLAMAPEVRAAVRENREFLVRAVRYLVGEAGIKQFVDIGAGIPAERPVHEVAQGVDPAARVAYVDNDTVVLVHARALLDRGRGTAVVDGDLRRPEDILDSPDLRRVIDLGEPVAVILIAVLHFVPDGDDPTGIVRRLMDRLPSGSHLVISHISDGGMPDDPRIVRTRELYQGALIFRPRERIESFFAGLERVGPGLVGVASWGGDGADETSWWLGGIARKP